MRIPDGLIMPLVYGLKALMTLDAKGNVVWKQDPVKFLDEHLGTSSENTASCWTPSVQIRRRSAKTKACTI